MKFQLIDVAKEDFPIIRLCHALGVAVPIRFIPRTCAG
jgi:hypothetical protein